jgi:hypothetical protein
VTFKWISCAVQLHTPLWAVFVRKERNASRGGLIQSGSDPSALHFRHRRQVRELFRNLAPLGLNSLIISCAKLCMKANQLDLRAAFFMFFTSDPKSNRKCLLILLFSGLDGRETLFIALLARCRLFPDAFRAAGVQCIDPTGGSLKMNSTSIAATPIAAPTLPVAALLEEPAFRVILKATKAPINDLRVPARNEQ